MTKLAFMHFTSKRTNGSFQGMESRAIAYLVGLENKPVPLVPGQKLTFGRDSSNSYFINDGRVSRNHAELRVNGTGLVTLIDLRSTNGTILNDSKITPGTPVPLKTGDTFSFGGMVVTLLRGQESHTVTSMAAEQARFNSKYGVESGSGIPNDPPVVAHDTGVHEPIADLNRSIACSSHHLESKLNEPCPSGGDLQSYFPAQIFQYLHKMNFKGELEMVNEPDEAVLSFDNGEIMFAMMGTELGIDVIGRVGVWKSGRFKYKALPIIQRPKNILLPTKNIVLQCLQLYGNPD